MILTDLQATAAYTLGRFLALAELAGDPLYRLAPKELIRRMREVPTTSKPFAKEKSNVATHRSNQD